LPENRPLTPADFSPEALANDSEALFARHEACGGDFLWAGTAFWGVPWLEAALGCPLYADNAAGSIHSEPPAALAGPGDLPEFDPANPWMTLMAQCFSALEERSGGRWPIGTTRMRGVSDLLAALYGNQSFVMAMLERPAEVAAVCERLTDFWIACARFQLDRIPLFHGGVGSFYYSMWCPEGAVWHQEDAVALLSPDLFERFIAPCARRIASSVPHCVMHLHSTGFLPVDAYLDMEFLAIELHRDEGGPTAEDLRETHLRILDRKPLLIWGPLTEEDRRCIFNRLPPQGLAVNAAVAGPEEAAAVRRRTRGDQNDA
jgi:5-methyltetrahydrofolate--homocysteine methyltransferase